MEIIIDMVAELHSLLRTRLPGPWDFVKLRAYRDMSCILNNVTYFIVYFTFISWFAEIFIARTQSACGRQLETKDKWLAAVISMVSAMHLLWPFLLFLTHFFTYEFYPWSTAIIVIILHLHLVSNTIRVLCYSLYSKFLNYLKHFKQNITYSWTFMFGTVGSFQPTFETISTSYLHEERMHSSIYDDIAPSSTPIIQPRLRVAEPSDYISSGTPPLQPREREEEYFLATDDSYPTHPQLTSEGQYRATETLRGHPWPKTGRRPSDDASPTIRPQCDSTAYSITTESETTKLLLDQIITNEESEASQKSKDSSPELTAETTKYTHDIKHTDDFGKDLSSHTDKNLVSNDFAQLNSKHKEQKIRFAEIQTATSDQHKRDFSQQANLPRRKIKATPFQKRSVKDSKKSHSKSAKGFYGGLSGCKRGQNMWLGVLWKL